MNKNDKNDKKIINLKEEINKQKEEIGKKEQFKPLTHCQLEYNGKKKNLNVLNKTELKFLAIKLNSDINSAKDLDFNIKELSLNGHLLTDWLADVLSKIRIFEYTQKASELNDLEKKIENMLSSEKKTELELEEISNLLLKRKRRIK